MKERGVVVAALALAACGTGAGGSTATATAPAPAPATAAATAPATATEATATADPSAYTDEEKLAANEERVDAIFAELKEMKLLRVPAADDPDWVKKIDAKCRAGSMKDCVELGTLYVDGGGEVRMDWDSAGRLFMAACATRAKDACRHLGTLASMDGAADHAKVALVLDAACAAKDADACSALAGITAAGRGVPADPAAAAALRERACKLGARDDCAK